jgi:hypothetical protein
MNVAEVLSIPYIRYIRSVDPVLYVSLLTWARRFQCEEMRRGCVVESSALERLRAPSFRRAAGPRAPSSRASPCSCATSSTGLRLLAADHRCARSTCPHGFAATASTCRPKCSRCGTIMDEAGEDRFRTSDAAR